MCRKKRGYKGKPLFGNHSTPCQTALAQGYAGVAPGQGVVPYTHHTLRFAAFWLQNPRYRAATSSCTNICTLAWHSGLIEVNSSPASHCSPSGLSVMTRA